LKAENDDLDKKIATIKTETAKKRETLTNKHEYEKRKLEVESDSEIKRLRKKMSDNLAVINDMDVDIKAALVDVRNASTAKKSAESDRDVSSLYLLTIVRFMYPHRVCYYYTLLDWHCPV
jgi:hypothetical protein